MSLPKAHGQPGLYIVFEGVDGAGKSTQMTRLAEACRRAGRAPTLLAEPTRGPAGAEIRRRALEGPPMSAEDEVRLFVEDRRRHVAEDIGPALAEGRLVLQDRSYLSTVAYQGSRPEAPYSRQELLALNAFAPRPDLVILLDLAPEVGLARVQARGRRDAFEDLHRQERVRAAFLAMADERFAVVDAAQHPDEIAAAIAEAVGAAFRQKGWPWTD